MQVDRRAEQTWQVLLLRLPTCLLLNVLTPPGSEYYGPCADRSANRPNRPIHCRFRFEESRAKAEPNAGLGGEILGECPTREARKTLTTSVISSDIEPAQAATPGNQKQADEKADLAQLALDERFREQERILMKGRKGIRRNPCLPAKLILDSFGRRVGKPRVLSPSNFPRPRSLRQDQDLAAANGLAWSAFVSCSRLAVTEIGRDTHGH